MVLRYTSYPVMALFVPALAPLQDRVVFCPRCGLVTLSFTVVGAVQAEYGKVYVMDSLTLLK